MTDERQPNPGSDEAAKAGCTCARIDNHYGQGYHGRAGSFMITGDCPLHGSPAVRALK